MININPNCKGTFPEGTGRKTKFGEMTQQHKETSVALLEKMERTFFTRAPFEYQKTYPSKNNSCSPRKKWEV